MDPWMKLIRQTEAYCGTISNKRVLDVGCDPEGRLIETMVTRFNAEEAIGLNLVINDRRIPTGCRLLRNDIRSTPFPENYFDHIFSSSAFEHIQDFDLALDEMYRILKPGGSLFSTFGPIWSTSYGHHLWLTYNNQQYTYWNVRLPAFCHLLQSPQSVYEFLLNEHPSDTSEAITNYIFDSPEQNRLFFDDYEHIIRSSRFETVLFKGFDHDELATIYQSHMSPNTLRQLKSRYPRGTGFFYDGITVVLRKPS